MSNENMENGVKVNGDANGVLPGRPRTPSLKTFSLTEYSSNPSPPRGSPGRKMKGIIPDEFLLPSGYPDVCVHQLLIV